MADAPMADRHLVWWQQELSAGRINKSRDLPWLLKDAAIVLDGDAEKAACEAARQWASTPDVPAAYGFQPIEPVRPPKPLPCKEAK